jgi:hypothetical protein
MQRSGDRWLFHGFDRRSPFFAREAAARRLLTCQNGRLRTRDCHFGSRYI